MQSRLPKRTKPNLKSISKRAVAAVQARHTAAHQHLPPLPKLQVVEGCVGAKCWIRGEEALIRYKGPVYFADGDWTGAQLRYPQKGWEGICDGSKDGIRYFTTDAACGIFVRPHEVHASPPKPPEVQVATPVSLLSVARTRRSAPKGDDSSLCGWDDGPSPVKETAQRVCRHVPEEDSSKPPTPKPEPAPEEQEVSAPREEPVAEEPPRPPTPPKEVPVDHRSVMWSCLEQMLRLVDKARDAHDCVVGEDAAALEAKETELRNVEPGDELQLGQCEGATEEFCNAIGTLPELGKEVLELVQQHPVAGHTTAENEERLRRLHFEVDEIAALKEEAIVKGDVAAVEQLFERSMACHEGITSELQSIITLLKTEEKQGLDDLEESVRSRRKALQAKIEGYNAQMHGIRKAAEEYFQNTFAFLTGKEEAGHVRRRQVMSKVHEATSEIDRNKESTRAKWAALTDTLKEVMRMVEQNETLVNSRLQDYDTLMDIDKSLHEVRKRTVERESHKECIMQKLDDVGRALEQNVQTCLAAFKEAEEALRDKRSAHFDATLASHNSHYHGFKGVYMLLGEYQQKRLMHKEALMEKLKTEEDLLAYYSESLNPQAKEHAINRDNIQKTIDSLTLQVSTLEEKLAAHEQLFVATSEKPLLEAGRELPHPREELEKLKDRSLAKLIAYRNLEPE